MGLRNKKHFNDCNIFFITTTCFSKMKLLAIGNSISIIQNSLQFTINKYDSKMLGYVIMPNHIHFVMFFQQGKDRIGFMRDFKNLHQQKLE
jgi:putative transposase